jgi:hypothetical protein
MALTDMKLETFAPELYQDIALNDLVMYAVYVLAEQKIKWHSRRGDDLIAFTDFGQLLSIIVTN